MKILKKVLSVVLLVIMGFTFAACGSNTPTKAVENTLKDLSDGKRDDINSMVTKAINKSIFGGAEDLSKEIQGGMTEETEKLLNEIVAKMDYKVNSEFVNGEKATVNVTLKGANISNAFKAYLGDLLTLSYVSDVLTTTPKEEYYLLVNSIFYEKLKVIEFDERTLDINLTKKEEKWVVDGDAAFYDLLLGKVSNNPDSNSN